MHSNFWHPALKIKAAKVTKVLSIAEQNWFAENIPMECHLRLRSQPSGTAVFMKVPSLADEGIFIRVMKTPSMAYEGIFIGKRIFDSSI